MGNNKMKTTNRGIPRQVNCHWHRRVQIFTHGVMRLRFIATHCCYGLILSVSSTFLSAPWVWAYDPNHAGTQMVADEKPRQLKGVGVTKRLGEFIDLQLRFRSDSGQMVSLENIFQGTFSDVSTGTPPGTLSPEVSKSILTDTPSSKVSKSLSPKTFPGRPPMPVLMTMVYYNCPSLCSYHLNGLNSVFKKMNWIPGKDFRFVAISMDHREDSKLASMKKANYIKNLGPRGQGVERGWHFLTGSEQNIKTLANQLGFGFRWDPKRQEYAHPAVAYIITPQGKIAQYLHGIQFDAKTLRLALVESSKGQVGTWVDQVLLFCYRFDPSKNEYTLAAYNIMRLGGLLTVIILGIILVPLWLRGFNSRPMKGV